MKNEEQAAAEPLLTEKGTDEERKTKDEGKGLRQNRRERWRMGECGTFAYGEREEPAAEPQGTMADPEAKLQGTVAGMLIKGKL